MRARGVSHLTGFSKVDTRQTTFDVDSLVNTDGAVRLYLAILRTYDSLPRSPQSKKECKEFLSGLTVVRGDQAAEVADLLRDHVFPEKGFKPGVLPSHLSNISLPYSYLDYINSLAISYAGTLDHDRLEAQAKSGGHSTYRATRTLFILKKGVDAESLSQTMSGRSYIPEAELEDNAAAKFGRSRAVVKFMCLDDFLQTFG